MIKILIETIIEIILLPIYLLSSIFFFISFNSDEKNEEKIIVFIHGWFTSNLTYLFIKRRFERKGFKVMRPNLGLHLGDIENNSKKLKEFMDSNDFKKVILIGASCGGLISYWYLQKLKGWERVAKFISIGTPFEGSNWSYLAFYSIAGIQMIPESKFLNKLSSEKILNKHKICCLSAEYDELVSQSSSSLKGVREEKIDELGHVRVQAFSEKTIEKIVDFVKNESQ